MLGVNVKIQSDIASVVAVAVASLDAHSHTRDLILNRSTTRREILTTLRMHKLS